MAKADSFLFYLTIAFVVLGFLALFSTSLGLAADNPKATFSVLYRQLLLGVGVGTILFLAGLFIPYDFWKKIALPLFVSAVILMLFVHFSPFGANFGGAKRWLVIGSFSLQPSEVLKFSFIVYLAAWLSSRRKDIGSIEHGLFPFLLITGVMGILLMVQSDLSTLIIITSGAGFLFFMAGGKIKHIGVLMILGILTFFILAIFTPYRAERIIVFLKPGYDPQDTGYHINQSLIAIGSGGLFGRGLGKSLQKFNNYLPEATSDSIFAVIGEEFGLVGSSVFILMFLLLLFRGFKIASSSPDSFGRLLAGGIAIFIVVQAFLNIGAMIGLAPIMGIPLPFVSQGGTALAINLAEMGVLLNISKYRKI